MTHGSCEGLACYSLPLRFYQERSCSTPWLKPLWPLKHLPGPYPSLPHWLGPWPGSLGPRGGGGVSHEFSESSTGANQGLGGTWILHNFRVLLKYNFTVVQKWEFIQNRNRKGHKLPHTPIKPVLTDVVRSAHRCPPLGLIHPPPLQPCPEASMVQAHFGSHFHFTLNTQDWNLHYFADTWSWGSVQPFSSWGKIKLLPTPDSFLLSCRHTRVKHYLLGNLCPGWEKNKPLGKRVQQPVCEWWGLQTYSFLLPDTRSGVTFYP